MKRVCFLLLLSLLIASNFIPLEAKAAAKGRPVWGHWLKPRHHVAAPEENQGIKTV